MLQMFKFRHIIYSTPVGLVVLIKFQLYSEYIMYVLILKKCINLILYS